MQIDVRIQAEPFDIASESAKLRSHDTGNTGALVTFVGYCRDEDGRLEALELDHYPGMAEAEIKRIAEKAFERWPLFTATAIHRFGKIDPGGEIVFVGVTSRHRKAAFEAAEYIMDFLKTRAPFWKKEHLADGSEGKWVDAKEADDEALERWSPKDAT